MNKTQLIKIIKEEINNVLVEEPGKTIRRSYSSTTFANYPMLIQQAGVGVLLALSPMGGGKSVMPAFEKFLDTIEQAKDSGQLTKQEYDTVISTLKDDSKKMRARIRQVVNQMNAKIEQK